MPLRNKQNQPKFKDYIARWHNDQNSSIGYCLNKSNSEQNSLTFDTKLDGKKPKVFEFSILLVRGSEEIEIGVTSLTFIGVLLRAEIGTTHIVWLIRPMLRLGRITFPNYSLNLYQSFDILLWTFLEFSVVKFENVIFYHLPLHVIMPRILI